MHAHNRHFRPLSGCTRTSGWLIGGASADAKSLTELYVAIEKCAGDAPLFESAVAFVASAEPPRNVGRIGAAEAGLLGISEDAGVTLFAIRPDGYIGLRADRDHLSALDRATALAESHRG